MLSSTASQGKKSRIVPLLNDTVQTEGGYDAGHAHGMSMGGPMMAGSIDLSPDYLFDSKGRVTDEGYVVLAIDHWCFGERAHETEMETVKAMLWQGRVLRVMMVYDSIRAIDWLVTRCDVDPSRVGTLGISMGSSMAQWLVALDERVKATVDICCLTEWHTLLAEKGLERHGIYYYVPGLLKHFTASDLNALIAPRAHLGLAGLRDGLTTTFARVPANPDTVLHSTGSKE